MAKLNSYSAVVKDKRTGRKVIVTSTNKNMKEFISDLRGNGYTVNPIKVKPTKEFNRIMDTTNCNPWDWQPRKHKNILRLIGKRKI